jgi:hypothetical protein
MQQPLAHTRSLYMHHSSTFLDTPARPTPARAFPGLGTLSALSKAVIVDALAMILGRLVLRLWPNFRRA